MPAYIIADTEITEITDPVAYADYMKKVGPIIEKYGGRFLVRGGRHEILEEGWSPNRLAVVEFPDMTALKAWYSSPEYAPLLAVRKRITRNYLVAVEGSG